MIARPASVLDCSVIICAYTDLRWDQLALAYRTAAAQLADHDQLVVVIDHHPALLSRARAEFGDALVIENTEEQGLSGARNSGVAAATGDVVVFLDDDACPEPGWLAAYRLAFADPSVSVVSGAVQPNWEHGRAPAWFPAEFGWVVGCDYRGLPADGASLRNPIGANMAIRRDVLRRVGGFAAVVGRVGTLPVGCEETDLCIRISQGDPDAVMIRSTAAAVRHFVPAKRTQWSYFMSRCFHEGRSKAVLTDRVGAGDGLASELQYTLTVLTSGVLRGFTSPAGLARSAAIVAGFGATLYGFGSGHAKRLSLSRTEGTENAAELGWLPMVLAEYELTDATPEPHPAPVADAAVRTRLLVTLDGAPVGCLDLGPAEPVPTADQIRSILELDRAAGPEDTAVMAYSGSDAHTPSVSVVIPTRGRSAELVRSVQSVLACDYPDFDVLVVDNNDRPGTVAEALGCLLDDPRLIVLHQPIKGVSPARNLGIATARGEIVAATDDDVVVSQQWLRALVAPFVDPEISCVTGLVLPAGFTSPAQEMFEEFGGFSKGFRPARYSLDAPPAGQLLYPYSPGIYGSGNNMAYRREEVAGLGGYNLRLGPGTPVRSGEDLDLFLTLMFDGGAIYYQPRAWVQHHHRASVEQLRSQLRDYGRGLAAVMIGWALSDRRRAVEIGSRLPAGLRRLLDPHSGKNEARSAAYPADLRRVEFRGLIEGAALTLRDMVRSPLPSGRRAIRTVAPISGQARQNDLGRNEPLNGTRPDPTRIEPLREVAQHAG